MEYSDSKITEETPPTEQRDRVDYWLRWLKAAKKAAKTHFDASKEAWCEYEKSAINDPKIADKDRDSDRPVYPIYWSSCKTIEPALYARSPKTVAKRRFDIDDPVATTSSLIAERFSAYLIERGHFDDAMSAGVQDFIHADKAAVQLVYEYDEEQVEETAPVISDGTRYVFQDTQEAVESEPVYAEDGVTLLASRTVTKEVNKRLRLAPLCYNEVLHTPEAKTEAEIIDKAYFFSVEKEEALKRFQLDPKLPIPWKTSKSAKDEDQDEERPESSGQFLEGWEIWCKTTKRVYWVCEEYPHDFLKPAEPDPFGLTGFFPSTPFIISSKPSKSLYPTPAWVHLRPTARQLNLMYSRVFSLIRSVRRRAIVDQAVPEVLTALSELENNEFVTVKNMQSIVEKGGLQNLVLYLPVQELVTAISELNQLTDLFKANFYEWFGVPDIMRAISDPVESLGAQELKQGNANDRFKKNRMNVQHLARNGIEMMLDLALKVYDEGEILEICGGQFLPPEHQQNFSAALQLLKDDRSRVIRLDIETDSTNFIDEQWQQQNRNTTANTIVTGLQSISQLAQQTPQFVPTALRTLLSTVAAIGGGKEFEEGVKKAVSGLMEQIENPAPPPPPPPDYEMLKLEIEKEKNQIKREENQLKAQEIQLQAARLQSDQVVEQVDAQLKAAKLEAEQSLETVWQQIEQLKIQLQEKERMIEEQRLAIQTQLEAMKPEPAPAPQTQPVMINLGASQGQPTNRTKKVTPIRDPDGNLISAVIEEVIQ